jgi:hypothetical protein
LFSDHYTTKHIIWVQLANTGGVPKSCGPFLCKSPLAMTFTHYIHS